MKKLALFVFIIVAAAVFSGCLGGTTDTTEQTIKTDDGEVKVKTETKTDGETTIYEQTFESDAGTETVKVTSKAGKDDWCPEGGDWDMKSTGVGGTATASMKIDKLVTSGKYAGLCHVVYTAKSPDGEMKIDYWFDESGNRGFYEMDINGQKISQEWTG